MVGRVLVLGMRLFYVAIGLLGLSLAASGYPPSGDGLPDTLLVGIGLVAVAVVGVARPDLVLSGSGSVE